MEKAENLGFRNHFLEIRNRLHKERHVFESFDASKEMMDFFPGWVEDYVKSSIVVMGSFHII